MSAGSHSCSAFLINLWKCMCSAMWHAFTSDCMQSYNMQSQSSYMQKAVWGIFTSAFPETLVLLYLKTASAVQFLSYPSHQVWCFLVPPVETLGLPSLPAKNKVWHSPHSLCRLFTSVHDSLRQKWDDPLRVSLQILFMVTSPQVKSPK